MFHDITFEDNHPTRQRSDILVVAIFFVQPKRTAVCWLPLGIEVGHHRNKAVTALPKTVQMALVMAAFRIMCKMEFGAGNTQKTKPVQMVDYLIDQCEKGACLFLSLAVKPKDLIASDAALQPVIA